MKRRMKRRIWPAVVVMLSVLCAFSGLGTTDLKRLPGFLAAKKETVQSVKIIADSGQKGQSASFGRKLNIREDDVAGGYYYQQLSRPQQRLYKEMYQGLLEAAPSIYIHSPDLEPIKKVCQFIFNDKPALFWLLGQMQITSYSDYSEIRPVYSCTGAERDRKQSEINEAADKCLAGVSPGFTEYDKIKYVFEYLVNTVDYDINAPDNQNIYSALVGKMSVCAGYSRAAQFLLQCLGIECIYVTGEIKNQGPHAWNIVKCDGQYYQMDVTFGDPVFLKAESGETLPEKSINYDYLCCSDAEIMKNHTTDRQASYPPCNSMELNYYKLNGMYYGNFQPDQLLQEMNNTIYHKKPFFICKFANDTVYGQARDIVLNKLVKQAAQTLLDVYGLNEVQYTYMEDSLMDKITIFWSYE